VELSNIVSLIPTAFSISVYLTVMAAFIVAMSRRRRRPRKELARAPRVTIFKPLAGDDDGLVENLDSFARLDYPAFELLFGVASPDDSALAVARRFIARHPHVDARIHLTNADDAVNPKVAQLITLDRHARGEIVVISDSNVRVAPDYLWSMVTELSAPGVGLVTSVFAGTGERTLGAALENLQLGTMIGPGVAAAALLTKRPFTVGKSMAMWRRDLVRLGGFPRVGNVLAEDHMLGRLFMAEGYGVKTSLDAVENRNIDCSVRRSIERHTRWAKMRRALAPTAFVFEPFLTPLIIATAVAVINPTKPTIAAVLVTAIVQSAFAFLSMRILRGHGMRWYYAPLEIVRTGLMVFCWLRACASRRIRWRGHDFMVLRESRIVPARSSSWSRIRAWARSSA
jgi:ceramide glucosyltransferase